MSSGNGNGFVGLEGFLLSEATEGLANGWNGVYLEPVWMLIIESVRRDRDGGHRRFRSMVLNRADFGAFVPETRKRLFTVLGVNRELK